MMAAGMRSWSVYVTRDGVPVYVGKVGETSEELARCAALSKFGVSEDDVADIDPDRGDVILPDEEFSVSPC